MIDETPPMREMQGSPPTPQTWRLAVDETLLDGDTDADKVQQAAALGVPGIEFAAAGLAARVDDISAVLRDMPVQAATVRLGTDYNFISPDEPTRQRALDALRYAMTDAVDIGASGVVIVPHSGAALGLPDLMPLKAPVQIAVELMTLHLRTLSDLAYVFGIKLYLHPVNRYESAFLNSLAQGVELRRRIKFNAHVLLAADTYHMALTEAHPLDALTDAAASVGHVYLAANNGALPGDGAGDMAAVRDALAGADTSGWAVMARRGVHDTPADTRALRRAVEHLRGAGF